MTKKEMLPNWSKIHTIIFDFDGVFTNNKVYLDEYGKESVRCDRSDGLGFDILRSFKNKYSWDVDYFILSKEKNPVVIRRAEKLKLKVFNNIKNKELFIKDYLKTKFGEFSESRYGVLYLGNDLNDLSSIRFCGFSIAPSDAHKKIKENVNLTLPALGGEGFVRAVIEKIINIDDMSLEEIQNII